MDLQNGHFVKYEMSERSGSEREKKSNATTTDTSKKADQFEIRDKFEKEI